MFGIQYSQPPLSLHMQLFWSVPFKLDWANALKLKLNIVTWIMNRLVFKHFIQIIHKTWYSPVYCRGRLHLGRFWHRGSAGWCCGTCPASRSWRTCRASRPWYCPSWWGTWSCRPCRRTPACCRTTAVWRWSGRWTPSWRHQSSRSSSWTDSQSPGSGQAHLNCCLVPKQLYIMSAGQHINSGPEKNNKRKRSLDTFQYIHSFILL